MTMQENKRKYRRLIERRPKKVKTENVLNKKQTKKKNQENLHVNDLTEKVKNISVC